MHEHAQTPEFVWPRLEWQIMTSLPTRPFSAKTNSEKEQVDTDFPVSARTGLLHLVSEAIDKRYVAGWHSVAKEARRIARAPLRNYQTHTVADFKAAQEDSETYLNQLSWDHAFDFCERLHNELAHGESYNQEGEIIEVTTKVQAQEFVAVELQRLFDEEGFAYEFRNGAVERRGKRHTLGQAEKAVKALTDHKLDAARRHYSKALRHFRDRHKPDCENAVKEAVCAVESAAKDLYPEAKAATLGDFIRWATTNERRLLPKGIGQTFTGLYVFRNSAEGVSHGSTLGDVVTLEATEYILAIAASQVLLLTDLVPDSGEPPF